MNKIYIHITITMFLTTVATCEKLEASGKEEILKVLGQLNIECHENERSEYQKANLTKYVDLENECCHFSYNGKSLFNISRENSYGLSRINAYVYELNLKSDSLENCIEPVYGELSETISRYGITGNLSKTDNFFLDFLKHTRLKVEVFRKKLGIVKHFKEFATRYCAISDTSDVEKIDLNFIYHFNRDYDNSKFVKIYITCSENETKGSMTLV